MLVQMTISRREEEEGIGARLPSLTCATLGLCVTECHSPTQDKIRQLLAELMHKKV